MKRSLFCSLFFALALGSSPAWALDVAEGAALPPVKIAPHRAVYKMSLGSVKNGSSINSVGGTLAFDWADACDGWTVQQHMQMHFSYAEGEESEVNSTVVTWESKDGKAYRFNVRRLTDGKETENYKGRASLTPEGGAAQYTAPKDKKDVVLPAGSVFPSAHTVQIIQHGLEGKKLFTRRVYDGSDEEGAADVSAFIGGRVERAPDTELTAELRKNPLISGTPAWPVRLAFYKIGDESGAPDYEMDLMLQANGVARTMQIDYGEFSVAGVLTSIEPASALGCSDPK